MQERARTEVCVLAFYGVLWVMSVTAGGYSGLDHSNIRMWGSYVVKLSSRWALLGTEEVWGSLESRLLNVVHQKVGTAGCTVPPNHSNGHCMPYATKSMRLSCIPTSGCGVYMLLNCQAGGAVMPVRYRVGAF